MARAATVIEPTKAAAAYEAYSASKLNWSTATTTAADKPTAKQHAQQPAKQPAKAKTAASSRTHHAAKSGQTHLIYDSVTPSSIPPNYEAAVYSNGSYQASGSQVAGRHTVLWIDVNGSNTSAQVLDVEPGDATPSQAADWAKSKLQHDSSAVAIIYTMRSEWDSAKAAINGLPGWMQSHVRWWIADPTGQAHIVSGSQATQWYWGQNYDISTATSGLESMSGS